MHSYLSKWWWSQIPTFLAKTWVASVRLWWIPNRKRQNTFLAIPELMVFVSASSLSLPPSLRKSSSSMCCPDLTIFVFGFCVLFNKILKVQKYWYLLLFVFDPLMLGLPKHFSSPSPSFSFSFSSVSMSATSFFSHWFTFRRMTMLTMLMKELPMKMVRLEDFLMKMLTVKDLLMLTLKIKLMRMKMKPTLCWIYFTISSSGNFCLEWQKLVKSTFSEIIFRKQIMTSPLIPFAKKTMQFYKYKNHL